MSSRLQFARQAPWALWLVARSGGATATQRLLTHILDDAASRRTTLPRQLRDFMEAEARSAQGAYDRTVELLGADGWNLVPDAVNFRGAETLAEANLHRRDPQMAQRVLEITSRLKHRAAYDNAYWWMRCQVLLAEIYQDAGRSSDAVRIADELKAMLAGSDPAFPLLVRVEAILARR